MYHFTTLTLVFSLSFAPLALAQEVPAAGVAVPAPTETVTVTEPVSEVAAPGEAIEPAPATELLVETVPQTETQPEIVVVQDTANTQDTVTADVLQGTEDPVELATTTVAVEQLATTTEEILLPEEIPAESVPLQEDVVLDVVAHDVIPEPEPVAKTVPDVPVLILSQEDLTPRPEYTFAMTGKRLPTRRVVETPDGKDHEQVVAATITPQIDSAGTMHLSGACSNTYFVVLLFRNQDDYARDPHSYVINKAFPCENGTFAYQVSDLPDTLSGTYYLLIGEEGEKGPWAPITGLTEVTINKAY